MAYVLFLCWWQWVNIVVGGTEGAAAAAGTALRAVLRGGEAMCEFLQQGFLCSKQALRVEKVEDRAELLFE